MDLFPLWNSLRIAGAATCLTFFLGIFAACWVCHLPRSLKGICDVILTIPMVLPPTVVGFFLLQLLSPKDGLGAWLLSCFNIRIIMTWPAAIFAVVAGYFFWSHSSIRARIGRIRRDQHGIWLHARTNCHHRYNSIPTMEGRRYYAGVPLGIH